jgi:hypothetical protein
MSNVIPREVYEMLLGLGLSDLCAGKSVEGYGYILPEITVTPFESRYNEIFYDVEYGNYIVPEAPLPEAIPDGTFGIIVLLNSSGAGSSSFGSFGHVAILVGNEKYGWTYVSKDRYGSGGLGPLNSPSQYVVKEFRSFAQFKASAHNHSLKNGYIHSSIYGTEIDSLNYRVRRDSQGLPIERYDQSLFVPTDSIGNVAALAAAIQSAKKNYIVIFGGDCSDVPTKALRAAGKKDGEPTFEELLHDYVIPREDNSLAPKGKQEKIYKRNIGTGARRIK